MILLKFSKRNRISQKQISYLKTKGSTNATKDDFGQLTLSDIRQIPIKLINEKEQQDFADKVDKLTQVIKKLQKAQTLFCDLLKSKFSIMTSIGLGNLRGPTLE